MADAGSTAWTRSTRSIMDSNASRPGSRAESVRDNDFLLPGKLRKMSPLVDGQSAVSTCGSGAAVPCCYCIRATAPLAERASQYW